MDGGVVTGEVWKLRRKFSQHGGELVVVGFPFLEEVALWHAGAGEEIFVLVGGLVVLLVVTVWKCLVELVVVWKSVVQW